MCGTSSTVDRLLVVHEASLVADGLVTECLRLPLAKAFNLGSARGFDRAVAVLAAQLRGASKDADVAAVREAVKVLDVDWSTTNPAQRRRLVSESLVAAGRATALVPARIQVPLGEQAQEVVAATRTNARSAQGLAIGADFNALDRRVVAHVTRSQGNFVRNEYGRRLQAFGEQARTLVATGLEQGLSRADIAASLDQAARANLIERQPFYWEVVAGAFVGQGRSFAQMSSYAEAGIDLYVIEAVLDERTTPICQFLHGKTFSVGDALRRFEQVERTEQPEDIKTLLPWVREQKDADSGRTQLYVNTPEGRTPIAEVTRPASGARDERGEFRPLVSDAALRDLGVSFPPYHGLCRTTTLAVV